MTWYECRFLLWEISKSYSICHMWQDKAPRTITLSKILVTGRFVFAWIVFWSQATGHNCLCNWQSTGRRFVLIRKMYKNYVHKYHVFKDNLLWTKTWSSSWTILAWNIFWSQVTEYESILKLRRLKYVQMKGHILFEGEIIAK